MAFSADEVRVLRRVLAQALHPAAPDRLHLALKGSGVGVSAAAPSFQTGLSPRPVT